MIRSEPATVKEHLQLLNKDREAILSTLSVDPLAKNTLTLHLIYKSSKLLKPSPMWNLHICL